ncbi:hypothetical protein Tcur_0421 [Thermomonospora curvata DSM 43183]|uniref:Uncharacterized protein n=1 Tax=Thermomonospora curvata (strain ATCC 19995 / DSM 43183 / JCM 3096 / KCTC 9072 / NBRC 15933 / NCIMB 10081 / Henssen B9) TaxID=471852 RepID=D1A2J9_THECD|nr:hypothetical protein Tcur_0421 [Thermomonospora curvata DSM 43183]
MGDGRDALERGRRHGMRHRRHLGLLLQVLLVVVAGLLGIVTDYATGAEETPFHLDPLKKAAAPGIVVLIVGHVIAYGWRPRPAGERCLFGTSSTGRRSGALRSAARRRCRPPIRPSRGPRTPRSGPSTPADRPRRPRRPPARPSATPDPACSALPYPSSSLSVHPIALKAPKYPSPMRLFRRTASPGQDGMSQSGRRHDLRRRGTGHPRDSRPQYPRPCGEESSVQNPAHNRRSRCGSGPAVREDRSGIRSYRDGTPA